MPEPETERVIVLVPDDDLVDAVHTAVEGVTGPRVAIEVVVDARDRADRATHLLGTAALPESVPVETTVAADPAGYVRDRVAGGRVARVVVGADVALALPGDAGVTVDRVPTGRRTRVRPLVQGGRRAGFLVTFSVAYAFYLAVGDPTDPFDLGTGAAVAGAVAATLSPVVAEPGTSLASVLVRGARATLFLPYLAVEVVRANLAVARVILAPSLPVAPRVVAYDPGPTGRFERAVLANALTLTPGTVTVDADGDALRVHALTAESRAALERGALARAVAWVFHGGDGR